MNKKLSFGIAIVVISVLLVITVSYASNGIIKNKIDEVMRIIQEKSGRRFQRKKDLVKSLKLDFDE